MRAVRTKPVTPDVLAATGRQKFRMEGAITLCQEAQQAVESNEDQELATELSSSQVTGNLTATVSGSSGYQGQL